MPARRTLQDDLLVVAKAIASREPEAAARIRASIEASPRVALARECRSAR